MTKYDILMCLICIMLVVSCVGGAVGYEVDGVPQVVEVSEDTPGILGALDWAVNSAGFMWDMLSFNIDGMPMVINMVFLFMALAIVVVIIFMVRGA